MQTCKLLRNICKLLRNILSIAKTLDIYFQIIVFQIGCCAFTFQTSKLATRVRTENFPKSSSSTSKARFYQCHGCFYLSILDQITNLLNQGDVSKSTSLVLISAVHFMDKWVKPFTKCVPAIKVTLSRQFSFVC